MSSLGCTSRPPVVLNLHQVAFGLRRGVLGASDNRMGVWTQGCSLPKCQGCASVHTWSPAKGTVLPVETLLLLALRQRIPPSGLTISGGEPTDQAAAVAELASQFRAAFPGAEVVLYTGLCWADFERRHAALMETLDVVVAGPYDNAQPATPLAGSGNQVVKLLTPLAQRLYTDWQKWPAHLQQVAAVGENQLVTVGIPDTSRMQEAAVEARAVKVSWQGKPSGREVSRRCASKGDTCHNAATGSNGE